MLRVRGHLIDDAEDGREAVERGTHAGEIETFMRASAPAERPAPAAQGKLPPR